MRILFKHRYHLMVVAILFIATIFMLSKVDGDAKEEIQSQAVKIIVAKEAEKHVSLEIAGFVRGENRADIAPMTSGKILRIFKREGEQVKKGDVLATIDTTQSDAQVAAASASVSALQKTLADSKKYYDQLVSQSKEAPNSNTNDEAVKSAKRGRDLQIQVAKDQLIAAQGALSIAQAAKNNSTVIAPFAGTITAVHGREGGFANFSAPLISVSTQNSKEIETYVSAAAGRSISVGSVANLQSSSGQPVSGTVTAVSLGNDTQSLKTLVRIHIDDTSNSVFLGDFLRGNILIPRLQNAVSIPRTAVISRGGDRVVFVMDENNIAKEQLIKISSEQDGMVQVIEGIDANQKVITEGQQYLINGSITKPYGEI